MSEQTAETGELKIVIDGQEYPCPLYETFTYREARTVKKETGLLMGEFFDALERGDSDAIFALALIAKLRDNPAFNVEDIYDLLLDDIDVPPRARPEEDMASPLADEPAVADGLKNKEQTSDEKEPSLT
jgi:hypothetical protein